LLGRNFTRISVASLKRSEKLLESDIYTLYIHYIYPDFGVIRFRFRLWTEAWPL
jgi:hypothetical protein